MLGDDQRPSDGVGTLYRGSRPTARPASGTAAEIKDSILDAVGDTPLVRLSRAGSWPKAQLIAKVEVCNQAGRSRTALRSALIEAAESDGALRPGGTIVEGTTGNTGAGLAVAAARKGYGPSP